MTTRTLMQEQEKLAQYFHQASKRRNGKFILSLDQARELASHNSLGFPHNALVFGGRQNTLDDHAHPEVVAPTVGTSTSHKAQLDVPSIFSSTNHSPSHSGQNSSVSPNKQLDEAKPEIKHLFDHEVPTSRHSS